MVWVYIVDIRIELRAFIICFVDHNLKLIFQQLPHFLEFLLLFGYLFNVLQTMAESFGRQREACGLVNTLFLQLINHLDIQLLLANLFVLDTEAPILKR